MPGKSASHSFVQTFSRNYLKVEKSNESGTFSLFEESLGSSEVVCAYVIVVFNFNFYLNYMKFFYFVLENKEAKNVPKSTYNLQISWSAREVKGWARGRFHTNYVPLLDNDSDFILQIEKSI